MKLTVKKTFRDKTDHVTVYEPGSILEVNDKERAADLVKRGLCAVYKGKAAGVTLIRFSRVQTARSTRT